MSLRIFFFSIFLLLKVMKPYESARVQEGYRFKLDIGNPNIFCPSPGYKCPNGKLHYLCEENGDVHRRCYNHKPISVTKKFRKTFVEGTNGIRNKIAIDMGIANMNIVYWSDELSAMADKFLRQCLRDYDPCMIIGELKVKVSQNIAFFRGKVTDRLPGRIVRHWYLELGPDIKNWRDYKKKHLSGKLGNITTMVYPLVEFIGCSGARMFQGNFIVCYYHPPYERSTFPKNFTTGRPCSNCSAARRTCSKTFAGLCGVDFEMSGVTFWNSNVLLLLAAIIALFLRAFFIKYSMNIVQ